jgi:hypothetical protein
MPDEAAGKRSGLLGMIHVPSHANEGSRWVRSGMETFGDWEVTAAHQLGPWGLHAQLGLQRLQAQTHARSCQHGGEH